MLRDSLKHRIEDASASKSYGPEILHGLIEKESSYRPNAVSETGVRGLCQITRQTTKELMKNYEFGFSPKDALKPENQIQMASVKLEELVKAVNHRYPKTSEVKRLELALHSYNAGYSAVTKAVSRGGLNGYQKFLPPGADKRYAEKVMMLSKSWVKEQKIVEVPKAPVYTINNHISDLSFTIVLVFVIFSISKYHNLLWRFLMSVESILIEDSIILIHQMKNEFLGQMEGHNKLANEVISILRTHGPRVDKNRDVLGIVNFQLVRMSVCIPEEFDNHPTVEKFRDRVQELLNSYDGKFQAET